MTVVCVIIAALPVYIALYHVMEREREAEGKRKRDKEGDNLRTAFYFKLFQITATFITKQTK